MQNEGEWHGQVGSGAGNRHAGPSGGREEGAPRVHTALRSPSSRLRRFVVAGTLPGEGLPEGCLGSACPWQNQNHWERDEVDRGRVCVRRPLMSVCDDPAA